MTEQASIATRSQETPRNQPLKPTLRQIHAQPIPIRTFPLPSFYPSNPLSLFHIAYVWLRQAIIPPAKEPSIVIQGQWHSETHSVHITDPASIRILWEKGFWGKGHLSRSEPNWLKREHVRRGLIQADVSEVYTASRRKERHMLKWQRARDEQKEIEMARALELKAPVGPMELLALPNSLADLQALPRLGLAKMREAMREESQNGGPPDETNQEHIFEEVSELEPTLPVRLEDIPDREHLQLTREEAFFLVFALGSLLVLADDGEPIPTDQLLTRFRSHSYFPCRPLDKLSPTDPFLFHYVVFHHFRAIGWCVRPGIKFGVDWLLYLDGPAFNHGEFGVVIVPSFSDPQWTEQPTLIDYLPKSWDWLMGTVRGLSHVYKSLVLVYVDIPPPSVFNTALRDHGIAGALKQYRVREVLVRRWSSNRNR